MTTDVHGRTDCQRSPTEVAAAEIVPPILRQYGELTRVALCEYLRPREPQRHLWSMVADYPRRGGRMLRPSLCIATARAFGASAEDAVRTAAALELLHNAFLVHDDIEDDSLERRGHLTLNALHGVSAAVNAGDALALLGLRALMDNRGRLGTLLTMRIMEEAERMARETLEGQALELGWQRDNAISLTEADYLQMVLRKTCWYTTIFPIRAGALIGTRGAIDADRFVRFGFFLGAAFQIQDDRLNLVGNHGTYGKEMCGDLWEGKRTLMLTYLMRRATPRQVSRLCAYLARPRSERTASEVAWLRDLMETYRCTDYAAEVAHSLVGATRHEYCLLYSELPDSRDKRFIEALPYWVLERS